MKTLCADVHLKTLLLLGLLVCCRFAYITTQSDARLTTEPSSDNTALPPTTATQVNPNTTDLSTTEQTTAAETTAPPGECPAPPIPAGMILTPAEVALFTTNDTVSWGCEKHDQCFTLKGGNGTQLCQGSGKWSGTAPTCQYDTSVYRCTDLTSDVQTSNVQLLVSGPHGNASDVTACGTTLTFQCRPGHEIEQNGTQVNSSCLRDSGWERNVNRVVCNAKFHFIGCLRLALDTLGDYTVTSLYPNGELQCRNYCRHGDTTRLFSVLLDADRCMCTNESAVVLGTPGESPDACDEPCTGYWHEFCGAKNGTNSTHVLGAAYYTVGGCYPGLQALMISNTTTDDPTITPVTCRQFCLLNGLPYAALGGTTCTCLEERHLDQLRASQAGLQLVSKTTYCYKKCEEDQTQWCGGPSAVNIFNLDPNLPYSNPGTCYELYLMGVRTHGYYKLKHGIDFCNMADNTSCADGWIGFDGQCYQFRLETSTATQAVSTCGAEGAHLITLLTVREVDFFSDTLSTFTPFNSTQPWLIGLHDADSSNRPVWADGTTIRQQRYTMRDPVSAVYGACVGVFYNLDQWVWASRHCTEEVEAFVCEKPSDAQLTEVGTCARAEHMVIGNHSVWLSGPVTVSICRQVCRGMENGDNLFALVNSNRCACVPGEELTFNLSVTAAPGQCQTPCPANAFQLCGNDKDPYVFSIYPPLKLIELSWSCEDLYHGGVNHSDTYMLDPIDGHYVRQYCNFTLHETMCPTSWFYVNGSCLRPVTGLALDVGEAMSLCDEQGGFLVTADPLGSRDDDLMSLLGNVALFRARMGVFWLGVTAPLKSQMYRQVDGSLLPATNFDEGLPARADNPCVIVSDTSGKWRTSNCFFDYRFVCQKDVLLRGDELLSKLTCVTEANLTAGLDTALTLEFSDPDMTLTLCVERCRGARAHLAAAVNVTSCRCYNYTGDWVKVLKEGEERVLCGQRCPGHQHQYCGDADLALVMIVEMYPTMANSCMQLYTEGVRQEATYILQDDNSSWPEPSTCFSADSDIDDDYLSNGWIQYQGHLYYFHPTFSGTADAREFCWEQGGGYLLSVVHPAEDTFLRITIGGLASYRYLRWLTGYTSAGQNDVPGWMAPDLFLHTPGDEFLCTGHSGCCVALNGSDTLMLSYRNCYHPGGFICKRPVARQGCYDSSPPAALTPILWDLPDMSALLCRQACRGADQGTVGYVIQGQACYCSNSLVHLQEKFVGNHNVSYTQCQTPCSGHAAQFCGGSGNILVYMDAVAYDTEKAETCAEILDNGLYLNLTYRLFDNHLSSDSSDVCYHECSELSASHPATLDTGDRMYRTNVTVTCPVGTHFPSGAQTAWAECTETGWDRSEHSFECISVSCPDISLQHATTNSTVSKFGTPVSVTCHQGFEVAGEAGIVSSYTVDCTHTGTWDPAVEDCQRKSCPSPFDLSKVQSLPPADVTFEYSTTLTLLCENGWQTENGTSVQTIMCNASSSWEPLPQHCTHHVLCSGLDLLDSNTTWYQRLPDILESNDADSQTVTVGVLVELGCYSGYELWDGTMAVTVECERDGQFRPQLENCTAVCDTNAFTYAHVSTEKDGLDTVAQVTCYEGYVLPNQLPTGTAVCVDGVWLNSTQCQLPSCSEVALTYAWVNVTSIGSTAVATVTCNQGYTFANNATEKTHVCWEGTWSPAIVDCKAVCPGLSPPYASVIITDTDYTTTADVSCYPGYQFIGGAQSVTLACVEGVWDDHPACQQPSCSEVVLTYSWVNVTSAGSTAVATVTCNQGYTFANNATEKTHVCWEGTWSPAIVDCKAVCPGLSPPFADVTITDTDHTTTADVSCYPGYQFVGGAQSVTLACVEGVWDDHSACRQLDCAPISLTNAEAQQSVTGGTAVATVTCLNLNTFADGSTQKTYVCTQGAWSPAVEDCLVRCPELVVGSATVERYVDTYGQEHATVRCQSGHHFHDYTTEVTVSCSSSGLWSQEITDDCVLSACNESHLTNLQRVTVNTIDTVGDAVLKRVDCHAGFQFPDLTTSRVYGCNGGGVWYPTLDNCSAIECATLHGNTNAAIQSENCTFLAEVTLTCSPGWRFADGQVTRVHQCQANKTWTPPPSYCSRVPSFLQSVTCAAILRQMLRITLATVC